MTRLWALEAGSDQGDLVPSSSGMPSLLQSQQVVRALHVELPQHEPLLKHLQMLQLLWMRTHKSWVHWKWVLDKCFALIYKKHWRGGGGAAEDRQLFKPAANPLQPLTHTQPPAFVQPDSKLPGIQELKYTKDIYTNTCQKSHFPSASWLFHGWQKKFHLAFTRQPLPPCNKIPQ